MSLITVGLVGAPLSGKRETLLRLARLSETKPTVFAIDMPAVDDWPAFQLRGICFETDGMRLETFSGGIPNHAQHEAIARADLLVLSLDSQEGPARQLGHGFFERNQVALLSKPRIYQLTKVDLAGAKKVRPEDFGRVTEPVVRTNLKTGDGYDALLAAIKSLVVPPN